MYCELLINFSFTQSEHEALVDRLKAIRINPYKAYAAFRHEIRNIVATNPNLRRFRDFMESRRRISAYDEPFVFVKNCPIDTELPEFSNVDPVAEKHEKKKHSLPRDSFSCTPKLQANTPFLI